MSLLVWLPLTNNFENKGLSNVTVTNTNVTIDHTDANLGGCGYFNGSARIQISLPSELTTLKNTTISAWIKCSGTTVLGGISHNGSAGQNSIGCCTLYNTGWQFNKSSSWVYVGSYTSNTNWKHVAVTIGEDTITTYMNGTVTATSSLSSQTLFSDLGTGNFIEIGSDFPGGDEYLTGRICDFRVYNHCLSKREIKELSKGLMTHLPLSWGANPNMIKNSYTFMNKNAGSSNQWTNSGLTYSSSTVIEDNTAPCKWVMKRVIANSKETNVGGAGCFYGIGTKGLATTDLTENEYYTYSFWAKSDSGVPSGLGAGSVVESQTMISNTGFGALTSDWRLHTVTFKFTKTDRLTNCFYVTVPASSTIDFQVCGIKLEKGQIATAYIPHVEETAYTSKGYANLYYNECSGYKRTTTISTGSGGSVSIGTNSPRNTGTNFAFHQIYLENGFPIGTTPNFTIAFWQKGIAQTQTRYADVVWLGVGASSSTTATARLRLETISTDGTSSGYVWYGNGVVTTSGGMCSLTANAGTWRHIVLTFDGTIFRQYVNGTQYNTSTLGSDYTGFKTYGTFAVGDTSANIQVELADVRVYGTCLSADDIKTLYNIPAEIDKTGKIFCGSLVEV